MKLHIARNNYNKAVQRHINALQNGTASPEHLRRSNERLDKTFLELERVQKEADTQQPSA
jgi:hypothetical protein